VPLKHKNLVKGVHQRQHRHNWECSRVFW